MINKIVIHALTVVLSCITFFSCTEEIDLNQINDLSLKPVVASNLLYFNAFASDFFIDGKELSTIKDAVVLDLFNRGFVVDNLIKAEFVFETTNSINKPFRLKVDFLNASNELKHSFTILVPASPSNKNLINSQTQVFEDDLLDDLKASNKIELTIQALSGGAPLNNNSLGTVKLNSKSLFYLNIDY